MKKLFLLSLILVCAVVLTLGGNKTSSVLTARSEKPQKISSEVPSEKHGKLKTELPKTLKVLPSVEDLEKQYIRLSSQEIDNLIKEIEDSKSMKRLISEANKGKLSAEDRSELISLIRMKTALTKLSMNKKFEELEVL